MKSFLKWVSKEYVYMLGYSLSIFMLIAGIYVINGMLIFLGTFLFLGITQKALKEWKNILKRYAKIHNKKKPSQL
ncbi:MAG: hypothetical protein RLZZ546_735 [Bacteroidota bacterium]|jgi:hypothetical protein